MSPRISFRVGIGVCALLFLILPTLVALHDSKTTRPALREVAMPAPDRPPPAVEPLVVKEIPPETARSINAAIPFSSAPNPAARPFQFTGTPDDRERAVACLAAAQYYEAGDDAVGEKAVAQVVLNRVRHPAFPKTVCGVVFQGSERSTGCQFTFTCDGALARTPAAAGWERARTIAAQMLSGTVYKPVGTATHYHTDWVVPYWSDSLDKITNVKTHLFFRWKGYWGTPHAFVSRAYGAEPQVPQLATLAPIHGQPGPALPVGDPLAKILGGSAAAMADAPRVYGADEAKAPTQLPPGVRLVAATPTDDSFILELPRSISIGNYADIARTFCSGRQQCRIMAWQAGRSVPTGFKLDNAALSAMSFSYIHNIETGLQRMLWNCDVVVAPEGGRCMRERIPVERPPERVIPLGPATSSPPALAAPPPVSTAGRTFQAATQ